MTDMVAMLTEVSGLDEAVVRPFVEGAAEEMTVDEMADVLCRLQPHIDVLGLAEVQQAVHKMVKEHRMGQLLPYLEKKENAQPTTQQPKIGFFRKLLSREAKDKAAKTKKGTHSCVEETPHSEGGNNGGGKEEKKGGGKEKKDGKKGESEKHVKASKTYGTELDLPEPQITTPPPAVVIDDSQLPVGVTAAAGPRGNKLQIPQSSELAKKLVDTEHELAQKYNFMQQKSMTLKSEETHPAGHRYTEFDDILNKFIEDKGK